MIKPKKLLVVLLITSSIIIFGLAAFTLFLSHEMCSPHDFRKSPVTLDIAPGSRFRSIAEKLYESGCIQYPDLFTLWAILKNKTHSIKAGEYWLADPMSPDDILKKLTSGEVLLHSITIPEGYNIYEIARAWEQISDDSAEEFTTELDNFKSDLLERPLSGWEGYLFPDTYKFPKRTQSRTLITMMITRFSNIWKAEYEKSCNINGFDRHKIITLASLIEKEACIDEERPVISSVYHNRLRIGMLLQCDPTVLYARGPDKTGDITQSELDNDHPYNTYVKAGLPPGPICSPGESSIAAACFPASSRYLYFVASDENRHIFSESLDKHLRAVAQYRMKKK